MLAQSTPATAFPGAALALATYQARHPVWAQWALGGGTLWSMAPTLDAPGRTLAARIAHHAAWVLDTALAQMPAQVTLWQWAAPAVTAAWQTWVQIATQPVSGWPTATLTLTPGAQAALTRLQAWDAVLGQNAPADPGVLLSQVLSGIQFGAAPHQAAPVATVLRPTVARDGQSLMALAAEALGDPDAWPRLVAANHLRPPYISPRLWDQTGPPVLVWQVSAPSGSVWTAIDPVSAGATTLGLPDAPPFTVQPGMLLAFEQTTATGRQQEIGTLAAWDATTGTATLTAGTQNGYNAGALVGLMLNPQQQTTQVLAPGDLLYVPDTGTPADPHLTQATDPLGTDLLVTADGGLVFTGTGDLATVSGVGNVLGALARRLRTPRGGLPLHPSYGTRLPDVIGLPLGHGVALKAYVIEALLQDPRVQAVPAVQVTVDGTTVRIQASVQIRGWAQVLPLTATTTLTP